MLDVALAPDFAASRRIWFSAATAIPGGVVTRLWRAVLDGNALREVTGVLDATPAQPRGRNHYGGRITFSPDGRYLFLTTGERNQDARRAQSLGDLAGKVLRLTAAGEVPRDNPFVGQAGARGPRSGAWGTATRRASRTTPPPARCSPPNSARSAAMS